MSAQPSIDRRNTPYARLDVEPIAGALGAEVGGIDLARPLDAETVAEIERALAEHLVIVFRDQALDVEQHKALGRCFGTLNVHPQYVALEGHPEVFPVVKDPADAHNIGGVWHADITFLEAPAMGAILYGLEVPAYGGDTMFANQYLAYESLSDGMRELLDPMRALHSDHTLSNVAEAERRNASRTTKIDPAAMGKPPIENYHPVVRTHPVTGRKSLFVNRSFTRRFENMTEEESRPLLDFLYAHAARPEFTCRIGWRKHSVVFWDNRCVLHYAVNDYPGERRYMHRVTIDGDRPV